MSQVKLNLPQDLVDAMGRAKLDGHGSFSKITAQALREYLERLPAPPRAGIRRAPIGHLPLFRKNHRAP